ncbi:MAG: hypothetical protein HOV77_05875 [Hamadaea sp.]|uniref:hypothetical protein n=1 Tax=Hamadaea sp. TaxID=2024425 RepID=UPI0017F74D83|nr:hypothetical protein [Hamadaea sp.]NUT18693.1 hypothetical protein [Hamadaea sp.]
MADEAGPAWQADWVPVERRWLGLDRRTLLPAGLVVLLVLIAGWIVPAINKSVQVDDPIQAGEIVQVGPGVQFTPVAGANLAAGLRQSPDTPAGEYPKTAAVTYQGLVFEVVTDTYHGTPTQLLEQIKTNAKGLRGAAAGFQVTSDPIIIANSAGQHGVAAHYDGLGQTGLVAAFVFGDTGVEIQLYGPPNLPDTLSQPVAAMLQSVRPVDRSGS